MGSTEPGRLELERPDTCGPESGEKLEASENSLRTAPPSYETIDARISPPRRHTTTESFVPGEMHFEMLGCSSEIPMMFVTYSSPVSSVPSSLTTRTTTSESVAAQ